MLNGGLKRRTLKAVRRALVDSVRPWRNVRDQQFPSPLTEMLPWQGSQAWRFRRL
jgi:hypothetical protein